MTENNGDATRLELQDLIGSSDADEGWVPFPDVDGVEFYLHFVPKDVLSRKAQDLQVVSTKRGRQITVLNVSKWFDWLARDIFTDVRGLFNYTNSFENRRLLLTRCEGAEEFVDTSIVNVANFKEEEKKSDATTSENTVSDS